MGEGHQPSVAFDFDWTTNQVGYPLEDVEIRLRSRSRGAYKVNTSAGFAGSSKGRPKAKIPVFSESGDADRPFCPLSRNATFRSYLSCPVHA